MLYAVFLALRFCAPSFVQGAHIRADQRSRSGRAPGHGVGSGGRAADRSLSDLQTTGPDKRRRWCSRSRTATVESTAAAAATIGGTWDKVAISRRVGERPLLPTADICTYAHAGWLKVGNDFALVSRWRFISGSKPFDKGVQFAGDSGCCGNSRLVASQQIGALYEQKGWSMSWTKDDYDYLVKRGRAWDKATEESQMRGSRNMVPGGLESHAHPVPHELSGITEDEPGTGNEDIAPSDD